MTVHELICETCGAINRDAAEPCWRCREALQPAAASAESPSLVLNRAS
jgi:ribosomal protein L40E